MSAFSRRVILALLDHRDLLGYELNHDEGLLETEEYEALVAPLIKEQRTEPNLSQLVGQLAELIPDRIDSEICTVVFNVSTEDANKALDEYTANRSTD